MGLPTPCMLWTAGAAWSRFFVRVAVVASRREQRLALFLGTVAVIW